MEAKVMKTFKVTYKEVLYHEFYVNAEFESDVENEFCRMANENELDFSDGDLVEGNIVKIEEV
jgi:hypothetical protein